MKTRDWEVTVSFPFINYFKHIILDIVRVQIMTTENESKESQKTKKDEVLSKEQGDYIHVQDVFKYPLSMWTLNKIQRKWM